MKKLKCGCEGECKVLSLNKKEKTWMVRVMERRSVNRDPKGRGPIPCILAGNNYIPEYLKDHPDTMRVAQAKFIGDTHSGKAQHLDRWECPYCRESKRAECRFNLSPKKRGYTWKCRFCGGMLALIKEKIK